MARFNEVMEKNIETLKLYVPIVERVHGQGHPEFHDVRRLFDGINEKIDNSGVEKPLLDKEFNKLREITDNYTTPKDVCESYEAVYNMLSELDSVYHNSK